MRSHLQFRNAALVDDGIDADAPGGEKLARFLAAGLSPHGVEVTEVLQEDWGWVVKIANPGFPLWIGCGHQLDHADGQLCFIEPHKPVIRKWLKRIDTTPAVSRVAAAMEAVVRSHPESSDIAWWSDDEVARG